MSYHDLQVIGMSVITCLTLLLNHTATGNVRVRLDSGSVVDYTSVGIQVKPTNLEYNGVWSGNYTL
jgi:hypothetical protein